MSSTPNTDKVRVINFDRLDELVSGRLAALKVMVQNLDKLDTSPQTTEKICGDLIMPAIYLLAEFLEAVKIEDKP